MPYFSNRIPFRPWCCLWQPVVFTAICLTAGCEADPPEAQSAPPPQVVHTEDWTRSAISPEMMRQFADEAARELAAKLPATVADQPTKVVLGFAPIANRSSIDVETLRIINDRLRSSMTQAKSVQDSFIVVSGEYEDDRALIQRFQPSGTAMFDPTGAGSGQPAQYDPSLMYFLQLTALDAAVGNQRQLDLTVNFTHPQSRRALLATTLDTCLRWDSDAGGWIVSQDP